MNASEPWYLWLINDVNAYLSPYQLLEVTTHQLAILMLPGFKEAWKGSVTLRLRHGKEVCFALTHLSYSRWREMFIVQSWRCTIACHMYYTCIQFHYGIAISAVGALVKQYAIRSVSLSNFLCSRISILDEGLRSSVLVLFISIGVFVFVSAFCTSIK